MRNYRFSIFLIFVVLALCISCATSSLGDYNAKSTDEEEVIQVIIRAKKAWDDHDESGFSAEFCPNGEFAYRQFASNKGEKVTISKAEIPKHFQLALDGMYDYELINPKLTIIGDKAILNVTRPGSSYTWPVKITFLRENEKWCIKDWDFNLAY